MSQVSVLGIDLAKQLFHVVGEESVVFCPFAKQSPISRRVKKPKTISFLAFLDPPTSAPGLDFPLVMPHTHSQRKPLEQRW